MNIARANVYRYTLPLREPLPLPHGTLSHRTGLLLRLESGAGATGWGEAAPLPGFSRESLEDATAALIRCAQFLAGHTGPLDLGAPEAKGLVEALQLPSVSFALEAATLQLRAADEGPSLHRFLSREPCSTVCINALLAGSRNEILARAATLEAEGYRAAKLKVGRQTLEDDIALTLDVRDALGEKVALRLDANRAWNLDTAITYAKAIAACRPEYIEEPVQKPLDILPFHEATGLPYALDETLQHMGDPQDGWPQSGDDPARAVPFYQLLQHAEAAIWKPTLFHFPNIGAVIAQGGLRASKIVLSAAFESGAGIATLAQYAAAYSGPNTPVGLDTYSWLAEDLLTEPLPFNHGILNLDAAAAAAAHIDPGKLIVLFEG